MALRVAFFRAPREGMGQASKKNERSKREQMKKKKKLILTLSSVPVPSWTTSLYSLVEDG